MGEAPNFSRGLFNKLDSVVSLSIYLVIVQPQRHGDTKIIIYSFNAIFNKRYVLDLQFSGIDSSLVDKVL